MDVRAAGICIGRRQMKLNLEQFMSSSYRAFWITEPGLSYFVRKSLFFSGVIELANCSAPPKSKVFGLWRFLRKYQDTIPFYMEQVINPNLERYVERCGWLRYDIGGIPQFASPLMQEMFRDNERFIRMFGKVEHG